MEKSLYKYIIKHTKKDQVWLILLTLASMPLVYYSLEIPKLIINKAIGGGAITFAVFGFEFTQIQYLLLLSGLFLLMVIVNGGMKYFINVYRGILGERMLRRFRYTLYRRILRFPLPHLNNTSPGEIIPMVTAESEPLGGFIGDSIALPVMQGGLLITYLSFIFAQDFWLGLASIALYPPQIYFIPKLQNKVNQLSKQRVQRVRKLSDRIGESVTGLSDIRANAAGQFESADISARLSGLFFLRVDIFQRKFFIKFLNNFLAQLTPFFFYAIGGYLVLKNQLSLGALVAVLAAYKDIAPPWKELLKFYQISEDIKVKYAQIIEQFAPDGMTPRAALQDAPAAEAKTLRGDVKIKRLKYAEDAAVSLDGVDAELRGDMHTAIISRDGGGDDELAQLLARLLSPTAGTVRIGEDDLQTLAETVSGRRIGYCAAASKLFNASIGDNLFYGLKQQPRDDATDQTAARKQFIKEAAAAGNSVMDINADWVDIRVGGARTRAEFDEQVLNIVGCVELEDELLQQALRATNGLHLAQDICAAIVKLRARVIKAIGEIEDAAIVEPLAADRYIHNFTVEENLLFGAPVGQTAAEFIAAEPVMQNILARAGLQQDLAVIGVELAGLMVELFSDVPESSELFEQFSFIKADELPAYRRLVATAKTAGADSITAAQRKQLIAVSLQLCPARHRLDLINPAIQKKVVAARAELMRELGGDNARIQFFNADEYHPGMSVQDNLLFGKIAHAKGHMQPRIIATMQAVLQAAGLHAPLVLAGLNCPVGINGARLAAATRQKLVVARALLKDPDILIINNALASLDAKSRARIMDKVLKHRAGRNVIWAVNDPQLAARFDSVLLLEKHKVARHDAPQALAAELAAM